MNKCIVARSLTAVVTPEDLARALAKNEQIRELERQAMEKKVSK